MVVDVTEASRYEMPAADGTVAGFVTYERRGDRVRLLHAEVDPSLRGRGLGGVLVQGVLDDLRRRGLQAVPVCPFVVEHLRRHPQPLGG